MGRTRNIAEFLGKTTVTNTSNDTLLTSASEAG